MKKVWIAYILITVLSVQNMAVAKPEYLDVFTSVYKTNTEKLADRSCANCHVSVSEYGLNPYGKQIAHELVTANTRTLTADILHRVETMFAFQDGTTNLEKITGGLPPGEAIPGSTAKTTITESAVSPAPPKSVIPKNVFHPAIVHFPIALFIAGLFLDFIGWRKKQHTMLMAGWYNLVFAAVSTVGSIGSGLLAMFNMHLPFKGLIFTHLILASIASVLMWMLVALRIHRHEKMDTSLRVVYYVLAFATVILISYSAHLGGAFVYGE